MGLLEITLVAALLTAAPEEKTDPPYALHVLQPRPYADAGRHEVVLYPAAAQLFGRFSQHVGTAATYLFHVREDFAVWFTPQYHWLAQPSALSRELVDKAGLAPLPASAVLLSWAAHAGVEYAPIYGKLTLHDGVIGRFDFVIGAGFGLGGTQHELKPPNSSGPATYGNVGLRPTGSLSAGFRVHLGERFALRLEVRDVLFASRVDRVNGCNAADLSALIDARAAGAPLDAAGVGRSCSVSAFEGTERSGRPRADDLVPALDLVREPSSDIINLVGFYAGLSVLF